MHQFINKKNKIIIYLLLLFILSTTSGKLPDNQSNYFFTIDQVNIRGLSKANNSKILNELHNLFYKNILIVGRVEIKKVLSRYNIIEEYNIKKIYPSTINIDIKPTKIIAKISSKNQLFVGANGKLIEGGNNDKLLPYIFGKFNLEDFLFFKKNIKRSNFVFTDFKTLYFFPSSRWDILTYDDTLIKLPQDNLFESLNYAYAIINDNNFKNKKLIDLRMKTHLIIK